MRIETPEHLLVGATSPGGPFVIIGHNGHLAWSLTTTHSDTQDLFLEKLDPADPARYCDARRHCRFRDTHGDDPCSRRRG